MNECKVITNEAGRYSLVPPVQGGEQFWLINDRQEMYALVSISVHFPNAEEEARRLYDQLLVQESAAGRLEAHHKAVHVMLAALRKAEGALLYDQQDGGSNHGVLVDIAKAIEEGRKL